MLIGLPASGKSTWIKECRFDLNANVVVVSSDNHIENYAIRLGKTYNDVFQYYIKTATSLMFKDVADAIYNDCDIIWDQTNLSVKSRKSKLKLIPNTYQKIAVVFETPDNSEHTRRLDARVGKNIPLAVISNMKGQLEIPSLLEGFDIIIFGFSSKSLFLN